MSYTDGNRLPPKEQVGFGPRAQGAGTGIRIQLLSSSEGGSQATPSMFLVPLGNCNTVMGSQRNLFS